MGQYVKLSFQKKGEYKSQKTTQENWQSWTDLIKAEKIGFKKCFSIGCSKCENGRIKKRNKILGWKAEICDCWFEYSQKKDIFDNLIKSNLPKSITHQNPLQKYEESSFPKEKIKSFYQSEKYNNWLYIQGEVGAGKTFLAVVIAQIYLLNGRSIYFSTAGRP